MQAQTVHQRHRVRPGCLREQYCKLFPAKPPENVSSPDALRHNRRKVSERTVSGCVAVNVIDCFEVIDVEDGNREPGFRAVSTLDMQLGLSHKLTPHEGTGQLIDSRQPLHPLRHAVIGKHERADRETWQGDDAEREKRNGQWRWLEKPRVMFPADASGESTSNMNEPAKRGDNRDELITVPGSMQRPSGVGYPPNRQTHVGEKGRHQNNPGSCVRRKSGPVNNANHQHRERINLVNPRRSKAEEESATLQDKECGAGE